MDRPIFAVGGSYDWNVPPSELALWQANFAASVNPDERSTLLIDCMTHALNCIDQPDWQKITAADIEDGLDAELVPAITAFLRAN